ncbi:MAG: ParB/RepB/Spo0J family partition protein [Xanthomonadales bacterium]|nr:ParB/RepB/Spo0J family partition protein [Xanthomonadales bacterium]
MSSKKKPALGRNLSSMLSQSTLRHATEERPVGEAGGSLRKVPLDRIKPGPFQPRSVFEPERLAELADSIREQGVIQPIVVRPVGDEFEIIAGERRWRAAQQAGLDDIPVIVRQVDDEVAVALALIENIQRENLNPLEEAAALKRLVDDFALTHAEAAQAVGRSRSMVSNLLRLLELTAEVRDMVDARHLEMGHARALLSLDAEKQAAAAREVVRRKLSVRETEQLVRRIQNPPKPAAKKPDPDILRLQEDLAETLCAKVRIQHGAKGKGKLVIAYNSSDELEGIIGHLKDRG